MTSDTVDSRRTTLPPALTRRGGFATGQAGAFVPPFVSPRRQQTPPPAPTPGAAAAGAAETPVTETPAADSPPMVQETQLAGADFAPLSEMPADVAPFAFDDEPEEQETEAPAWGEPEAPEEAEAAPVLELDELNEGVSEAALELDTEHAADPEQLALAGDASSEAASQEPMDTVAELDPWGEAEDVLTAPPDAGVAAAEPPEAPADAGAELEHLADRVAQRLEELAQEVRSRGLGALRMSAAQDEAARSDELSRLIAALAAGFYAREE